MSYWDIEPDSAADGRIVGLDLPDISLRLRTGRGVFGHDRVDRGTHALLRAVPPPLPRASIVDLGTGYGPIACAIAVEAPEAQVWAVDVNTRALELTAENAVQDIAAPDMIELQNLRAKMEMQDKNVVNLSARAGTYNTKGDKIVLRDQIVVTSEQGYSAKLREAAVDMKQGNVLSDQPVEVVLPNGLLTSNGMEIGESGAVIRFNRGVVLTLDPAKQNEAAR